MAVGLPSEPPDAGAAPDTTTIGLGSRNATGKQTSRFPVPATTLSVAMDRLIGSAAGGDGEGRQWKRRYRLRLVIVDAVVIVVAVALAQFGRFWLLAADGPQADTDTEKAWVLSVLLAVIWYAALSVQES